MKQLTLATSPWGGTDSCYPFDAIFDNIVDPVKKGFDNVDAFVLWGGTDIHPSFYKADAHKFNQAPTFPSPRDMWEWKAMKYCKAKGIPMIGVCRGAQFMCAFAGGKLLQHVSGHGNGKHPVMCLDGAVFPVPSQHHQMLDLHGVEATLLGWTPTPLSSFYYGEHNLAPEHIQVAVTKEEFKEPEIVFFPEFKGLGIQGHPEWADLNSPFVERCNQYIIDYLFGGKKWQS